MNHNIIASVKRRRGRPSTGVVTRPLFKRVPSDSYDEMVSLVDAATEKAMRTKLLEAMKGWETCKKEFGLSEKQALEQLNYRLAGEKAELEAEIEHLKKSAPAIEANTDYKELYLEAMRELEVLRGRKRSEFDQT